MIFLVANADDLDSYDLQVHQLVIRRLRESLGRMEDMN